MLRRYPVALAVALMSTAVLLPLSASFAQSGDGGGRNWSVTLDVPGDQTDEQKIASLNKRIMEMQGRGETGPALGDLYNDLGVLHAERQEWAPARDAFIRAVQAKPFDPDFHRNLGKVFEQLQDYDLAIGEYTQYLESGGAAALDAYRALGRVNELVGDIPAARAAYQDGLAALGRAPSAETCRLALALAGLEDQQGDSQAKRTVLENWQPMARAWRDKAEAEGLTDGVSEAESIEHNLLVIYLEDGQIMEDSGLAAEAVDLYRKALELAPDRDELLPRIVGAQLASGDAFGAKVSARLFRQDYPDKSGAWLASGKAYEAEGQTREALEAYTKAYELAPDTPGLRLKVGNLYLVLGEGEQARSYLEEAIEAPDTPTEVVFNYAISLMRDKKYAAAVSPLRRVTAERPDFPGGWQALAQCYGALRQYGQAVPAYRKAMELKPDAVTAYNLGVVAGKAGDWDTAVAAYDQALELDPAKLEAEYNRANALKSAGRLEEAADAFAAYRERDSGNYKAGINHGVTLAKLGRLEEAAEVYNLLLEQKETPEVWNNLGLVYQEMGDKKRAQQCFREAKKVEGGS
jgi:tetratricopeptide (TPR) repeat protein